MTHKKIKNIPKQICFLFFNLYSTQSLGITFLSVALILVLYNNVTALDKLSLILLMSFSITFKVLWAPFIDKYLKTSSGYYQNWLLVAQFFLYFVSLPFVFICLSTIIMDNVASSIALATTYNAQTAIGFVFVFIVVSLSFYLAQTWGYFVITAGSIAIAFFCHISGNHSPPKSARLTLTL
jgi:hypothetical protein